VVVLGVKIVTSLTVTVVVVVINVVTGFVYVERCSYNLLRFKKKSGETKGFPLNVNFTNILRAAFCTNILSPKKLQSKTVRGEKLRKTFLYKKAARMFVKCWCS